MSKRVLDQMRDVVHYLAAAPREAWHAYPLTGRTTRYENEVTIPGYVAVLFATRPFFTLSPNRPPRLWLSIDRIVNQEQLPSHHLDGRNAILAVTPVFDTNDPLLAGIYGRIVGRVTSTLRAGDADLQQLIDTIAQS